jgi:hypothetical protein
LRNAALTLQQQGFARTLNMNSSPNAKKSGGLPLLLICLAGVLAVLFHNSFVPGKALFANDGPLGATLSRPYAMPDAFFGIWSDYHWLGFYGGHYFPNFTGVIQWLGGGMGRVNFSVPIAIMILGLCSWTFFRRLGCNAAVSILASLAAALNMNFMSNAAWGLPSRGLSLAASFLALAAIEAGFVVQPILTSILAGLAIGMSITEGGDNGAIFSMFIAAYAFWRTWISIPSRGKAVAWGMGKVIVMVVFAAIMAGPIIGVFARVAVKGVAGVNQTQQTKEEKEERWTFATQWSLPKVETLRVIIPGIFGYHMQPYAHDPAGSYWGRVGAHPSAPWSSRSSGAGEYAGVLVVLIGFWAVFESCRRSKSVFTTIERNLVGFWVVMAIVAMLLGWGRYAPFYKFIYALPYFSTIRNPMKFFHALHLASWFCSRMACWV